MEWHKKIDWGKYIPESLKNPWFWAYLFVVIIGIIALKSAVPITVKIVALVILCVFQGIYNLKVKYEKGIMIINWLIFLNLVLVTISYIAAAVKDYNIAGFMLLLMVATVLIASTSVYLIKLWELKDTHIKKPVIKLLALLITYTALAINIIIVFTYFFTISNAIPGNEIKNINNESLSDFGKTIFFSGTIFYSSTFGDYIPQGISMWITLIECWVSYIIHVIILGIAVSYFKKD